MTHRDIEASELAALEWAAELERRSWEADIPEDVRVARDWGDIGTLIARFGGEGGLADPVEPRASGLGLVSVPTMHKRFGVKPRRPFDVTAAAQAARRCLSAFEIDAESRRLAMLRMQVGVGARLHNARDVRSEECLMVTLTYRGDNDDWEPGHVRDFMTDVRNWCERRGFKARYVSVAELQQRGVIHYHVALWVPKGTRLPKPDQQGWWPHGMTRIEVARAAVPYLLKYLSKKESKAIGSFPKGARIYGVGGLDASARRTRRWLRLPSFVQGNADVADDWRRVDGGGWRTAAGQHLPSEFERVNVAGVWCMRRAWVHSRAIAADGPFCWIGREVITVQSQRSTWQAPDADTAPAFNLSALE